MGLRVRPLAAMLAIPAKSSLATSAVEAARAEEPVVEMALAPDANQDAPESPLAVAAPLTMGEPDLQIQLRATEPAQRAPRLFDLRFAVSTAVDPRR